MTPDQPQASEAPKPSAPQSPNTVDRALHEFEDKAKALDEKIHKAEEKHPPRIDHADDGGVV